MSNNLNNDNETTLLFKKFQGVAQTQVLTSDTGALSYTGEPKKSLTNIFQENIFSEKVPTDLSFTLLEIYNGVAFGPITDGDFSNNVNNQVIVTKDLSAGVFGVDLPLTYYNKLYLAPTNGTNQAWWFIDPGSTTSTNNNILKNMIPYLYNDVNPNTYTPIVEYYNGTNWVSEAQASGNGLNWSIDPASGILQFYQSNSILTSSPYQLNGITGGADISQNRPRISFIKYTGTFGSGTGGGGGGGSGLINVGKIDVSNNSVLSSYDVSGIYFDASGFDVSLNAGNTVTITNKGTSSGGIADLSYYFFNKPLAPTDGSGNLITQNTSQPYIRLNWTNPSNEQSALPYGTYTSYQIGASNESLVQNDRLPFFRHLHIEYLEYTAPGVSSGSPLLNSSWIDLSVNNSNPNQTVIPNTIIEAELTYGGAATDLCGNSPDPTIAPYTKLTYGGLDNSKTYQFRIYLDNSGTNGPFTAPVYGNDVSWNYLYIPNVSGGSIELGAFGPPNPPNQIQLIDLGYIGSGSSTELKFDASLSTVPPNYADASLNTPFPISASLSLAYAFGCTICGEILPTSRQMPISRYTDTSFNYDISSGLQKNGQVTFSYDTSVPNISSLESFDISACPEYKYTIHKPFGINNYDDPTFDPSFNLGLSTDISLPYPSRTEACVNSGAIIPLLGGPLGVVSGPGLDVSYASAYPAYNNTQISNVWFITPSNPGFDVSLNNPSIFHIANNIGNDLRGISSEGIELGYLKADISNTLFDVSSASQFKGYIQQTNGNPSSNPHIDWTASSKEAGKTTYPFQTQGYWTEIDISNIGIKDINLSSFPDICNNTYSPYTFNLQQIYNDNGIPDQPSGIQSYDFNIGQRPTEIIDLSFSQTNLLTANLNNQFFGQLRPSNSANISFNGLYSASLSNLDPWWRKDLTIGTQLLRYDFPSPISIGSATTTPWPMSVPLNPILPTIQLNNPNGSIIPVTFMTTTEQYSRTKTEVGTQFNILISHENNVLQLPLNPPVATVPLKFTVDASNLWWDYTYNSNSNPSINSVTGFTNFTSMNYLAGPLLPANKSSLTATGNGTWPTDTTGTGSGFFNTYQHSDDISYNQLMWANGCFGSGGTYSSPGTDNPYIDYPSKFYNPGPVVLKDYSPLSTTSDSVGYDLSAGLYWNQVPAGSPPPAAVTISGEYKWIVLKYSNLINKGFNVDVRDKSNTLLTRGDSNLVAPQTPGKYLMYICEENTGYTTAAGYPYNGRSGWLDAQVQQGSGSVTNQAVDGGGCWNNGVGYYKANRAGNPTSGGVASTLYLRIGIENNGLGEIASVVVEPVPGT